MPDLSAFSQPPAAEGVPSLVPDEKKEEKKPEEKKEEKKEEEANLDTTGITEVNITTLMSSAKCSRAVAIETLRKNNDDLVNSIMVCAFHGRLSCPFCHVVGAQQVSVLLFSCFPWIGRSNNVGQKKKKTWLHHFQHRI